MKTKILPVTFLFLILLAVGCGDSNNGSTTMTPTPVPAAPTQPSSATIAVEVLGFGAAGGPGGGNLFGIGLRMTESNGLGANINFVRLEVFRATGEFEERKEIGGGQIASQTGSNRLAANSTRDLNPVLFTFNATIKTGRVIQVTVGFTDDAGNNLEFVENFIFA